MFAIFMELFPVLSRRVAICVKAPGHGRNHAVDVLFFEVVVVITPAADTVGHAKMAVGPLVLSSFLLFLVLLFLVLLAFLVVRLSILFRDGMLLKSFAHHAHRAHDELDNASRGPVLFVRRRNSSITALPRLHVLVLMVYLPLDLVAEYKRPFLDYGKGLTLSRPAASWKRG